MNMKLNERMDLNGWVSDIRRPAGGIRQPANDIRRPAGTRPDPFGFHTSRLAPDTSTSRCRGRRKTLTHSVLVPPSAEPGRLSVGSAAVRASRALRPLGVRNPGTPSRARRRAAPAKSRAARAAGERRQQQSVALRLDEAEECGSAYGKLTSKLTRRASCNAGRGQPVCGPQEGRR